MMFFKSPPLKDYKYISNEQSDTPTNERFKEKLDFLAVSKVRRELVKELSQIYAKNRDYILDNFYEHLLAIDEFKAAKRYYYSFKSYLFKINSKTQMASFT